MKEIGGRQVIFSPDTGAFQVMSTGDTLTELKTPAGQRLGWGFGNTVIKDPLKQARIDAVTLRLKNADAQMRAWSEKSAPGKAAREEYKKLEKQLEGLLYEGEQPENPNDPLRLF